MESELHELCAQLQRDAGCRKVMVCGADGEVLAHVGDRGLLDDAATDAVAQLVVDALAAPSAAEPAELSGTLTGALGACATALADRAALVVIFDGATALERVRLKMRRARERLVKSLPGTGDPTETPRNS